MSLLSAMPARLLVRVGLCLILVAAAAPAVAQAGKEASERASAALGKGDFPTAIEQLTIAIESGELESDLLLISRLSRGQALILNGTPADSIADLDVVIASDGVSDRYRAVAYGSRATAYRLTGDHEAALADFTAAIELGAPGGRIYFDRGLVWESTGAYEKADQDFLEAYERDPNNPQIRDKIVSRGLTDRVED